MKTLKAKNFIAERQSNGDVWITNRIFNPNVIIIHQDKCAELAILMCPDVPELDNKVDYSRCGLQYALSIVKGRRILNRPPAYLAALDEMEIFLEAAIERVERGESMHAVNVVQEYCSKVDYSRCAGEPE